MDTTSLIDRARDWSIHSKFSLKSYTQSVSSLKPLLALPNKLKRDVFSALICSDNFWPEASEN
jgi:hypothetical protein